MIARVGYGATDGIRNLESELLTVDLTVLNGVSMANAPGISYPLPPSTNPDGLVAQVRVYCDEQFGLRKGVGASAKDVEDIYLSLRDVRGGFILYDFPLVRLAGVPNIGFPRMHAPRPLYIRPQMVDARQSYIYSTTAIQKTVVLEFIYA